MKKISIVVITYLCAYAFFGVAFGDTTKNGVETVEAAPTEIACCQNAEDRAKAEANKICNPARVKNLDIGECKSRTNDTVKEYFDCDRDWTVTCEDMPASGQETAGQEQSAQSDPCEGVSCSGHGQCISVDGFALCQCDPGYGPSGETGEGCVSSEEFQQQLETFLQEETP